MAGGLKLGLAAFALGAVVATAGVSVAGDGPAARQAAWYAKFDGFADVRGGPIQGIVATGQQPNRRRVRVFVSLHGLPVTDGASNTYLIVATKRPCSQAAPAGGDADSDGDVDGTDFALWRTVLTTTRADLFDKATPKLLGPLKSARSVRIYDRKDGGQPTQRACGPVQGT